MVDVNKTIAGKVHRLGADINTDEIISGKYCSITDFTQLAPHVLEAVVPNFAAQANPGDVIIAGKNFGCGSSREIAVDLLLYIGIKMVVAPSFARIFYRNAINRGLFIIECADIENAVTDGDIISYELANGKIKNLTQGIERNGSVIPDFLLDILSQGGAVAAYKNKLGK